MKKILSTALLFAGFLGMTSCDGFLDEEPKSAITGVSYYKTGDQIIANVNSMYRTGATDFMANMTGAYRGSSLSAQEMLVGYFQNDFEGQEVDFAFARNLTRQANTHLTCTNQSNNTWRYAYQVLNRANGVLKYIDDIEMNDKAQYKGEAQFYRALNYLYLVKFFGGVPNITEPTENMDNVFVTRDSEENIINQIIIPDLKGAVDNLPAATFAANGHRVTKYAAEMVLADVYMRVGQYGEAATVLKDVVNNSGHALTENDDLGMNSAFNILRENDDLPEVIWAYEYDGNISKNGNFPTHAFDGDAEKIFDGSYTLWVKTFGVSDRFLNVYEANDLRIQPNQFFHWTYTNPKNGKTWTSENGACNWYWYEEEAILETLSGKKDWNFYRYAEALLSAAESIAQSEGVTDEAKKYLAQVQARANMEGKTVAEIAAALPTDKQAFIEACWTERLREMPLEMKMWDLCVRTGKFPNISETVKGQVTYETLIGAKNGSGATFQATDLYWPIPIDEIQRNPELTQNDGYAAK